MATGTDSRIGVGFRLGPNADVQFQLELGPQTNTLPIGAGASTADVPAKKRHVPINSGGNSNPQEWLNMWRLKMNPGYASDDKEEVDDNSDEETVSNGPLEAVAHLRQLYKPQPTDTDYMT